MSESNESPWNIVWWILLFIVLLVLMVWTC